jgi:hypothetical protein
VVAVDAHGRPAQRRGQVVKPVSSPTTARAGQHAAISPTFRKGGTSPPQSAAMRSAMVCSASLPHSTTGVQPRLRSAGPPPPSAPRARASRAGWRWGSAPHSAPASGQATLGVRRPKSAACPAAGSPGASPPAPAALHRMQLARHREAAAGRASAATARGAGAVVAHQRAARLHAPTARSSAGPAGRAPGRSAPGAGRRAAPHGLPGVALRTAARHLRQAMGSTTLHAGVHLRDGRERRLDQPVDLRAGVMGSMSLTAGSACTTSPIDEVLTISSACVGTPVTFSAHGLPSRHQRRVEARVVVHLELAVDLEVGAAGRASASSASRQPARSWRCSCSRASLTRLARGAPRRRPAQRLRAHGVRLQRHDGQAVDHAAGGLAVQPRAGGTVEAGASVRADASSTSPAHQQQFVDALGGVVARLVVAVDGALVGGDLGIGHRWCGAPGLPRPTAGC